jgi:hypothetical protein
MQTVLKIGENNLNANERLEQFLKYIDDYIQSKNFIGPSFNEEFKIPENMGLDQMNFLTRDDCFNYAYMLYQYADFVARELSKNKSIILYCEDALNKILSREMVDMPQFTKHDMKVASILNENAVANKINDWKIVAQSRVDFLQNKEYNLRKKADCLMEKGKRK